MILTDADRIFDIGGTSARPGAALMRSAVLGKFKRMSCPGTHLLEPNASPAIRFSHITCFPPSPASQTTSSRPRDLSPLPRHIGAIGPDHLLSA
jgi:hypothetical protein